MLSQHELLVLVLLLLLLLLLKKTDTVIVILYNLAIRCPTRSITALQTVRYNSQ